ncbi:hypothetical protein PPERSA_04364 [Pseudocohnilembus persalinus]|uniref:Mitochondrial inner membrane protease ATP23 n=1 Tax=Pseudocohnilembus persalinus TaxID=266149 RepID=A0A0V0QRE5_PSEPJ|nr:hypothetical protein PPERSA_04364 [Pseudocohnilembus persalinus]|eukprot:KRX04549.1 hypothetical protein PPERSA_04364 [Pseudocohnilembus persalinus]
MVRIYDPERTDPTVVFLKTIQDTYKQTMHSLSHNEIQQALKKFLREKYYLKMLQDYQKKEADFPEILIKNNCRKGNYAYDIKNYGNKYFKAKYDQETNKITLCSNLMLNVLEFKENLDRELVMAYDRNILEKNLKQDADFTCSQIRACRAEIYNYKQQLDEKTEKQMTNICSRFLIKERGPNQENLPLDIWVRYVERLNDTYQNCYYMNEPFNFQQ